MSGRMLNATALLRTAVPADAYLPVSIDHRLGMQSGAALCAARNTAPSRAMFSCVGAKEEGPREGTLSARVTSSANVGPQ